MPTSRNAELEKNFLYFQSVVSSLMPENAGKYVLLRNQTCVEVHASVADAIHDGHRRYQDDMFSIQEVTDTPLDLGFFSHADAFG